MKKRDGTASGSCPVCDNKEPLIIINRINGTVFMSVECPDCRAKVNFGLDALLKLIQNAKEGELVVVHPTPKKVM